MKKLYATLAAAVVTTTAMSLQAESRSVVTPLTSAPAKTIVMSSYLNGRTASTEAPQTVTRDFTLAGGIHGQNVSARPAAIAREAEEEETTFPVHFLIKFPEKERAYAEPYVDMFGDGGWTMAFVMDPDWTPDQPLTAWDEVGPGEYDLMVQVNYEGSTLDDLGTIAYYKHVTLTEETTIEIDLGEATHDVYVASVMHDGKAFPVATSDEEIVVTTAEVRIELEDLPLHAGVMLWGVGDWHMLVNDMPEGTQYTKYQKFYDADSRDGCFYFRSYTGAITDNITINVTADDYRLLTGEFVVTEEDYAMANTYGTKFSIFNLVGTSNQGMGFGSYREMPDNPPTLQHIPVYASLPLSTEGNECVFQISCPLFFEDGEDFGKDGGNWLFNEQGTWVVPQYYNIIREDGRLSLSYLAPSPELNINADLNDVFFFGKAQLLSGLAMAMFDPEATDWPIVDFGAYAFQCGPYHERYQLPNPFKALSSVVYNGQEIGMNDLIGKPAAGASVELTFSDSDQLIGGTLANESSVTFGMQFTDIMDFIVPTATYYNVGNASGVVTDIFPVDDLATLRIAINDQNSMGDFTAISQVEISVAPEGTDEWAQLTTTIASYPGDSWSDVASAVLSHDVIADNTWYKARVKAIDAAGNYSVYTIGHCFAYGEPSAIEKVEAAAAVVKSVSYYDLMGRAVAQPAAGVYVKVATLTDGSTVTSKVVVR